MFLINSLERKLYQLIICRLEGDKINDNAYCDRIFRLLEKGIGGFIIFGGIKDHIKPFIDKLQSSSKTPLFIASDIERGVGQQIKGATDFPCAMAIASAIDRNNPSDISILEEMIRAISLEAIDIGINMPLIPVLDINTNPDNPIICTRAFSDDPLTVSFFGSKYIEIMEDLGLITCAKHFPGHGGTSVDSHISLPVINKSKKDLMEMEMVPYINAIKTGISSIMVGHLSIPALDKRPATVSKKIITGLLKRELEFKGLILTDALNMDAIRDYENLYSECLKAGAHILLHPEDPDTTVKELNKALELGMINETIIDETIEKILKIKVRIGDIKIHKCDYSKNYALSSEISKMSITAVKKGDALLPISDFNNVRLVFAGDTNLYQSSLLNEYFKSNNLSPSSKTVFIAIFTKISAREKAFTISEEEIEKIQKLIKNSGYSIVVSFGNPYILKFFKESDILISAYDSSEVAQMAVIGCLKGEIPFKGKSPIKIP